MWLVSRIDAGMGLITAMRLWGKSYLKIWKSLFGTYWRKHLFFILLGGVNSGSAVVASECSFVVEGHLEARFVSRDSPPTIDQQRNFRLAVDHGRWRIDTLAVDDKSYAAAFDGTNVYEIVDTGPAQKVAWAYITPGAYPVHLNWDKRLEWFSYASRDYLYTGGNACLMPWESVREDLIANLCISKLNWRSANDSGPDRADFVFDSALLEKGITNMYLLPQGSKNLTDREAKIQSLLKEYTNGFVVGHYEVKAWTNAGGCSLPARWLVQRSSPALGVNYEIEGGITRLSEHSGGPVDTALVPGRMTLVRDERFRSVERGANDIHYIVTNNVWPTKLEASSNPRTQSELVLRPLGAQRPKTLFKSLIIILFLVPIIILPMVRRKESKSTTTKG